MYGRLPLSVEGPLQMRLTEPLSALVVLRHSLSRAQVLVKLGPTVATAVGSPPNAASLY